MKHYTDPKTGCRIAEPDCADEWLFELWAIGCDYDGCTTIEEFKRLVDELVQYANNARKCLRNGKIFPIS